jgi:glutamate decarboxylase
MVQVEVTQGLIDNGSSSHALNLLGQHRNVHANIGKMDEGSASQSFGYSKQC